MALLAYAMVSALTMEVFELPWWTIFVFILFGSVAGYIEKVLEE